MIKCRKEIFFNNMANILFFKPLFLHRFPIFGMIMLQTELFITGMCFSSIFYMARTTGFQNTD